MWYLIYRAIPYGVLDRAISVTNSLKGVPLHKREVCGWTFVPEMDRTSMAALRICEGWERLWRLVPGQAYHLGGGDLLSLIDMGLRERGHVHPVPMGMHQSSVFQL